MGLTALPSVNTPVDEDFLAPTGFRYSTAPRNAYANNTVAPASGTLFMTAIVLPAGFTVGRIGFSSFTTAAVSPTHWWFGLYDSSRVQLATTADQLTAAWGTTTWKNLAITATAAGAASSFTTTYTGMHYLGFLMTATTPINLVCGTSVLSTVTTPFLAGASSTGQTTPPAFPFTAGAITSNAAIPYAAVGA